MLMFSPISFPIAKVTLALTKRKEMVRDNNDFIVFIRCLYFAINDNIDYEV